MALVVEGALITAAFLLGWLLNCPPLAKISQPFDIGTSNGVAILIGVVATVPMLIFMVLIDRMSFGPFGNLSKAIDQKVAPWLATLTITEAMFIALLAGVGEELLFRGVIQRLPAVWGFGDAIVGLAIASILFGVCHWVTRTYAILAAFIGFYLGFLFIATDSLLTPIVTHVLYDFVAIIYLQRTRNQQHSLVYDLNGD